jgi:ABC-2 type transport system ATP-binding protein
MITTQELTKNYALVPVVQDVSFACEPGTITGFLGPNGAGKSTTLRMITGLTPPTRGGSWVAGKPFRDWPNPGHVAGVLLDASAVHPGRTGGSHLRNAAALMGVPAQRADELMVQLGIGDAIKKKIGKYSLGMRQRLGLAHALLADPPLLMLDEPINGLDPDGVVWIRHLLRSLADEGRTVFVSSHLMSEVAQTADHLVVIGRGRLVADVPTSQLLRAGAPSVSVRADQAAKLGTLLVSRGAHVERPAAEALEVRGLSARDIAQVAYDHQLLVHELTPRSRSLEEAFLDLTHNAVEFRGSSDTPGEAGDLLATVGPSTESR